MNSSFRSTVFCIFLSVSLFVSASEYHVSVYGDDKNNGTISQPFRTIMAAAQLALPGDTITVYSGTYREWVAPPVGGSSDSKRIVYRAAEGNHVEIKGSEIISGWSLMSNGVWKVRIPNSFFGNYNPYIDELKGDWLIYRGRIFHTGEVYLNGKSLFEAENMDGVVNPTIFKLSMSKTVETEPLDTDAAMYTWYAEVDDNHTTIYANFHAYDPNSELVEINVRPACFYPNTPGINYIVVSGFTMRHAATQWAPPTAEQIGLIGTHWSKGWIIENNIISDSKCSGITLGKDRASGHNIRLQDPDMEGYVAQYTVIEKAIELGWTKETVGSHIVRNNIIYNCEQTGICGHMGGAFSEISNNHIYNIWVKRLFHGYEQAAIKLHGAVDGIIRGNRLHDSRKGLWLDWMTQGTLVYGNLCYRNYDEDLFIEVSHGPYLIANNILLSSFSLRDWSHGGVFAHNLFAGKIYREEVLNRTTPWLEPHGTKIAGKSKIVSGDNQFYNNIFSRDNIPPPKNRLGKTMSYGMDLYAYAELPNVAEGNVYLRGSKPYKYEKVYIELPNDPDISLVENENEVILKMNFEPAVFNVKTKIIKSEMLGRAAISDQPWTNPDGSSFTIDFDYYGKQRKSDNPFPGPFEKTTPGENIFIVWKKE